MTAIRDWDVADDADLALAATAGDRAAFTQIYDRYADRLFDFCYSMVRDRDTAADCVQDTFCTAATRLETLRAADRLRPWLYAIARNEALRRIRERQREQPSDELPETASNEPGPDALAARTELADLISQAAGGLSDRDREVLDLTYRHGLDGAELAQALGVSAAGARTLTHRLKDTVERSLGALLVVRRSKAGQGCPELTASLENWNGEFTVLFRKRVARHIDSCDACSDDRKELVNPRALLGVPLFIPAPISLRDRTLDRVELTSADTAITETALAKAASEGVSAGQEKRRLLPTIAATTIAAGIALGLALLWPPVDSTPSKSVVESRTVTPSGAAPTPVAPRPTQTRPSTTDSPVNSPSALPPNVGPGPSNSPPQAAPPTVPAQGPTTPVVIAVPTTAALDPVQESPVPTELAPPLQNPAAPRDGGNGTAPPGPSAPSASTTPPTNTYTLTPPKTLTPSNSPSSPSNPLDTSGKPGPSGSFTSTTDPSPGITTKPDGLSPGLTTKPDGPSSGITTKPDGPSKSLTSTSGGSNGISNNPGTSSTSNTSSKK